MHVDLFCKQEGVAHQVIKARNQASNGKAARMHRTVLNMARCMVLLPISRYATGEMLKSTLHTS